MSAEHEHFLLVDDVGAIRAVERSIPDGAGRHVVTATGPVEAHTRFDGEAPDGRRR